MNRLEDQLTSAADEARRQIAQVDTRPASTVRARLHRRRTLAGAAVAAGVFGLLGATALVANNDDGGTSGFAASPSTAVTDATPFTTAAGAAEQGEATPTPDESVVNEPDGSDESTPTTTMILRLGATDSLLPEDWAEALGDDAVVVLHEDGFGFALVPDTEAPDGWRIVQDTAPALHSILYVPGQEAYAGLGLPDLALGFVVNEGGTEVTVFGVAPIGTESVTVALNGVDNLQIDQVTGHADIDRSTFATVVPASRLEGLKTGTPLMAPRDADGSPMTKWTRDYAVATHSIDAYRGPLRALFTVEMPLVAESIEIDTIPDVLACEPAEKPIRGGLVTDGGVFPTSVEAVEALLASHTYDGVKLADDGYIEMTTPDGSIHYGIPFDGQLDNGLVTVITVIPTDAGWTVSEWQASGC